MDALRSITLNNLIHSNTTLSSSSTNYPSITTIESIDNTKINSLVETFKNLNKCEQILFLTRIGGGPPTRLELEDTRNWLKANFIEDEMVALPKEEVYGMYRDHSLEKGIKPVSTADFGKVVRQVFTKVKARRLGQRGQSRYCYANIRRKTKPDEPILPIIQPIDLQEEISTSTFLTTMGKLFGTEFNSLEEVGLLIVQQSQANHHQNGCNDKSSSNTPRSRSSQKRLESPSAMIEKGILKREDSCDEMSMYFRTDSPSTTNVTTPTATNSISPPQWPHLRQLLTSNTKFQPLKRHRHYSSVNSEQIHSSDISPTDSNAGGGGAGTISILRSQSVPLYYIQDVEIDSGLSSLTNTPNSNIGRNPMLSSVSDDIIKIVTDPTLSTMLAETTGPNPSMDEQAALDQEFDLGFGDGTFGGDFEEGL